MDVAALAPVPSSGDAEQSMSIAAVPGTAGVAAAVGGPAQPRQRVGLGPTISQLFGQAVARPQALDITYQVSPDNEIVIVFSDPNTGKEVATFPPHLFAQLAGFLDHQQGAAVDLDA